LIKSVVSFDKLFARFETDEALADALISSDPEIDFEFTGRIAKNMTRVNLDHNGSLVYKIKQIEEVYEPDGTFKEEREPKYLEANINVETAIKGGKLFPKKEIYNKFIFAKKYQIRHVNGLTFDFLYEIAKELEEKESFMMIGAGAKGNAPLIFQNDGKPYRAFLEGRTKGESYCLIMHITNLELKALPK